MCPKLALPDFTGLAGWTDSWVPRTSSTGVSWGTTGSEYNVAEPSSKLDKVPSIKEDTGLQQHHVED